jgi:preflagellin peptidase FlaK
MMEESLVFLAITGTIIASITDLRKGIIPNKLTFPLVGIGVAGYLLYSLLIESIGPFLECLKSVGVIFAIGYLFWVLGGWSAGDAKEFIFIAALIPRYPEFLREYFSPTTAPYPFIISILVNTFLALFPFIVLYSMTKVRVSRFLEPLKDTKKYLSASLALVAALAISASVRTPLLFFIVLPVLYKIREGHRLLICCLAIAVSIVLGFQTAFFSAAYFLLTFAFLIVLGIFWNSINILRKEALQEEVKISQLREGMVLAEEIYIQGDEVVREAKGFTEKIKEAIERKDVTRLKKRGIATRAAGISPEEMDLLKGYVAQGKLEDRVKIRKSMPFAPAIAIGLLIALVYGDVALALQKWFYG